MAGQLSKGASEEYEEHKETLKGLNGHRLSKKIAQDHLKKDPDYYKESKEKKMAEGSKWIQKARDKMEKKGTVGSLRKIAGVAGDEKISDSKLNALASRAKRTGNTELARKVNFAKNVS